ncbi:MAG: hypothetical protein ABEJ94_12260 [Halorientalis sp.]
MSHHSTEYYYALIEDLIADQQAVWGSSAIEIADSVTGLAVSAPVSDTDDIWVTGEPKQVADALAEAYIDRFGQTAASSMQAVATEYGEDIDLPQTLRQ